MRSVPRHAQRDRENSSSPVQTEAANQQIPASSLDNSQADGLGTGRIQENHGHPFVSEAHEGKPLIEGIVFTLVILSALVSIMGHTMAATVIISATAIFTGILSLLLQEHSPWKVRSAPFDAFISICLGIGLILTYLSIQLLL